MKTIKEQIEVMQHFANGGEVEVYYSNVNTWADMTDKHSFNWYGSNYRIKEKKQTVIIEKWLCEYEGCKELKGSKRFIIIEKIVPFEIGGLKKVKLLDSNEVEL